jgi:hypothetical protein
VIRAALAKGSWPDEDLRSPAPGSIRPWPDGPSPGAGERCPVAVPVRVLGCGRNGTATGVQVRGCYPPSGGMRSRWPRWQAAVVTGAKGGGQHSPSPRVTAAWPGNPHGESSGEVSPPNRHERGPAPAA